MTVVYEDNHVIVVLKESGEIVQGDKTGDTPLSETVKHYLKEKYHKPGNVFLGVVHRLDRPVAGLVVFAKTSKALTRLDALFARGDVEKTYWALVEHVPPQSKGTLLSWLLRDEQRNKCYAYDKEVAGARMAMLEYTLLGQAEGFFLVEVRLLTGRHHQIRCQLSSIGCPILGDVKYGAKEGCGDGSIALLSHRLRFVHPVSKEEIDIVAPLPDNPLWRSAARCAAQRNNTSVG